jgi:mRNA interferase MazF
MRKDFDKWNKEKKQTNSRKGRFYHEREIWWCSLGVNVGYEQDAHGLLFQRPVLVVKGLSVNTCIVIPLTTSGEAHLMRISLGKIGKKEAFAVISQLRVVDTRRFTERLHIVDKELFKNIQKTIRKLF